jgi:hypothetical protein
LNERWRVALAARHCMKFDRRIRGFTRTGAAVCCDAAALTCAGSDIPPKASSASLRFLKLNFPAGRVTCPKRRYVTPVCHPRRPADRGRIAPRGFGRPDIAADAVKRLYGP